MKTYLRLATLSRPARGLALGTALLAASGSLVAQGEGRAPDPIPGNRVEVRGSDKTFAEKVARASLAGVEISRVAAERTSNPDVKAFAQLMATDHASLTDELSQIAARKGVALPAKDRVGEKWTKQNARNFDREYLEKMADDHEDTVKLFQKQATEGEDAELVAFARKHLPHLQHHLEKAKDLQRLLK